MQGWRINFWTRAPILMKFSTMIRLTATRIHSRLLFWCHCGKLYTPQYASVAPQENYYFKNTIYVHPFYLCRSLLFKIRVTNCKFVPFSVEIIPWKLTQFLFPLYSSNWFFSLSKARIEMTSALSSLLQVLAMQYENEIVKCYYVENPLHQKSKNANTTMKNCTK